MTTMVNRFCLAVAANVIIAGTFGYPVSAHAASTHDRQHHYYRHHHFVRHRGVGITGNNALGGNFQWSYGPSIAWYYAPHTNCVPRQRVSINRHGRRTVVKEYVCYE